MSSNSDSLHDVLPTIEHRVSNEQSASPSSCVSTTPEHKKEVPLKGARDTYFKVIDVRNDGQGAQVQGECYHKSNLDDFYKTVPAQEPHTIRVILNGRQYAENHLTEHPKPSVERTSVTDRCWIPYPMSGRPERCPLYPISIHHRRWAYYSLPVLRKMEMENEFQQWYAANAYAWHRRSCPLSPKHHHLYESQKYESINVGFAVDWSEIGKPKVICSAWHARVEVPIRLAEECSSASWRWFELIDLILRKPGLLSSLTDGDQKQTLRLLLLNIMSATIQRTAAFLDETTFEVQSFINEFDTRLVRHVSRAHFADKIGGWSLLYRRIEDNLTYLKGAVDCLMEQVRRHDKTACDDPCSPLARCLHDMAIDSDFYKYQAAQKRINYSEIFQVLSYRVTAKQADSVTRLTRLAALFLPMSLAAAILSMQSRFSDLNLLLYDFVGVVVILGSIAFAASHIVRSGPGIYRLIMALNYGDAVIISPRLMGFLNVFWFSIWWIAVLAAFLVGMLRDPIVGMKIFGFQAAGITGFWILSLKGVRMAYNHYHQRKRGKRENYETRVQGTNVSG